MAWIEAHEIFRGVTNKILINTDRINAVCLRASTTPVGKGSYKTCIVMDGQFIEVSESLQHIGEMIDESTVGRITGVREHDR